MKADLTRKQFSSCERSWLWYYSVLSITFVAGAGSIWFSFCIHWWVTSHTSKVRLFFRDLCSFHHPQVNCPAHPRVTKELMVENQRHLCSQVRLRPGILEALQTFKMYICYYSYVFSVPLFMAFTYILQKWLHMQLRNHTWFILILALKIIWTWILFNTHRNVSQRVLDRFNLD